MNKQQKINKRYYNTSIGLLKKWASFENILSNRVTYILNTILSEYEMELDWWEWDNYDAKFHVNYFDDYYFTVDWQIKEEKNWKDFIMVSEESQKWHFEEGIPTKWVFEDFEEELKDGHERYLKMKNDKKLKAKIRKSIQEQEKEDALAKLSEQERRVLGLLKK